MDALSLVNTAGYLLLAVLVGLRAQRTGQLALRRLALYLLGISATLAAARLLTEPFVALGVAGVLAALLVYPVLLLRFGAAVARRRQGLERAALVAAGVELLVLVTIAGVAGGRSGLLSAVMVAAVAALLAHVAVATLLVRQASAMTSGFVRRRAVLLAGSVVVLGLSFLVGMAGAVVLEGSETFAMAGGAVAALLLTAATSPPRWLQAAFVLRDHDVLMEAEARLLHGDDPTALPALLDGLVRLVGGSGALLLTEGQVLARTGHVPDEVVEDVDRTSGHAVDVAGGDSVWVLTADGVGCQLVVTTGEDPILYGLDVADLIPRTASRIGVALASRDAEARRRAQAAAEQEADHFREMAELKDDLLSTINHELRTPMTLVNGGLELLVHRWDAMDDEQRRQFIGRAHDHAGQLQGVVDQVLALAGLRSGEVVPHCQPVSSHAVVAAAVADLGDQGRIQRSDTVAVWLSTDVELLTRTIRELVDNALRHTDGPVLLRTSCAEGTVRFTVADHGAGFDTGLRDEMARGGHYLHRTTRGLGLGLSLATETLAALGGQLEVTSGPDGTTASCVLQVDGAVAPVEVGAGVN